MNASNVLLIIFLDILVNLISLKMHKNVRKEGFSAQNSLIYSSKPKRFKTRLGTTSQIKTGPANKHILGHTSNYY